MSGVCGMIRKANPVGPERAALHVRVGAPRPIRLARTIYSGPRRKPPKRHTLDEVMHEFVLQEE